MRREIQKVPLARHRGAHDGLLHDGLHVDQRRGAIVFCVQSVQGKPRLQRYDL